MSPTKQDFRSGAHPHETVGWVQSSSGELGTMQPLPFVRCPR